MKILIIFFFIITALNSFGQTNNVVVNNLRSKQLTSILCNVDTSVFRSNDNLSVRIYQVSNKSGSAKLKESDEVSKRLLIAVSSIDDAPTQKLYGVNNLINLQIVSFIQKTDDSYLLTVEFGTVKYRFKKAIYISMNKCFIK